MKHLKFLLALALALGLWSACKDHFTGLEKSADITFAGRIIDENNQALSGALVEAGGESAITDANGVFRLKPVRLPSNDARLSVRKAGYFEFSRAYIVEDEALQPVTIQLLEKTQVGVIVATQGGMVQVPGGPALTFPANGIATANGNLYNGTVLVYARFLDPSAPDLALRMPGDLRGINAGGEEQLLATFGMIAVEINGQGGEALNIAAGSEVEITMPIATNQIAAASSSIPLWYFDLDKARWIEEGSAQKVGSQYVGKVKHFSFWNCDDPYDLVILHGKVFVGDEQHPLSNAVVFIELAGGLGSGSGYTDANGCFGGAVPKDILMYIKVFEYGVGGVCSPQPIYTQTIGPFSSDVVLPPIILQTSQVPFVTVKGRLLDCNSQPVSKGYAKIQLNNGVTFAAFTALDGTFQWNFPYCNGLSITGKVIAYDLNEYLESAEQLFNVSPNQVQIGDLLVCNALTEFIQYTLDGQSFTFVDPFAYGYETGNGLPNNYRTEITTFDSLPSNAQISFNFYSNQQPGIFPLAGLYVNQLESDSSSILVNTTVTAFGNIGDPIIGTFDGSFKSSNGSNHTINGSYRVVRQ